MIEFFTVDVVTITSHRSRSEFDASLIEDLSEQILKTGGLVRPLVLKQTGIESFEVVEGDLEFFAAVRAYEKDPRKAEMVNALVLKPESQETVLAQIASLKAITPATTTVVTTATQSNHADVSGAWVSSVETRLAELRQLYQQVEGQIKVNFAKLEKQSEANKYVSLLDFINNAPEAQLVSKLGHYFVQPNQLKLILESRKKSDKNGFSSYQELKEKTKKLGETSILKAIDRWEQYRQ